MKPTTIPYPALNSHLWKYDLVSYIASPAPFFKFDVIVNHWISLVKIINMADKMNTQQQCVGLKDIVVSPDYTKHGAGPGKLY